VEDGDGSTSGGQVQRSDPVLKMDAGLDVGCGPNPLLGSLIANTHSGSLHETVVAETQDIDQKEGGARSNKHIRFCSEDSDYSEFSDSLEDHFEEQERRLRAKIIRRHKRRLARGVANPLGPPMESRNLKCSKELRGRGWHSMEECRLKGADVDREGEMEVDSGKAASEKVGRAYRHDGGGMTILSPKRPVERTTSGLRQIMEEQRRESEGSIKLDVERDPVKQFEASKLFGIQNEAGFNFSMAEGVSKRLIHSEQVDQINKVAREQLRSDQ
jgi:hypothetical protein